MRMFLLFLMMMMISCSSSKSKISHADSDIYISSGVERFFHASRPSWSRFSEISSCKQPELKFFNFQQLKQNYQFNYSKSISLQNLYNTMIIERLGDNAKKTDQNKVFFEAYQQIDSGAKPFPPVRSQKIYIISVDSYLNSNSARIKSYIERDLLNRGQVFLISRCLNSIELKKWKVDNQIYFQVGVIGFDFFSTYDSSIKQMNHWGVELEELFPKKEIYFISKEAVEALYINGFKKKWTY